MHQSILWVAGIILLKGLYHARIYTLEKKEDSRLIARLTEQHNVSVVSDVVMYAGALFAGASPWVLSGVAIAMYAGVFQGLIWKALGESWWKPYTDHYMLGRFRIPVPIRNRVLWLFIAGALLLSGLQDGLFGG